jgi:glycine cleavage system H protein
MGDTGSKTLLYPEELKYVKTHEWVRIEGDSATIGITSFAADQLGDVTFVELPKVGSKFKKEEKFGVIESVKSVSDLFMPLAGEITAINDKLTSEAEIVNLDCYNEGWMLKVKMDNKGDLDDSLSADEYKKFVVE